MGCTADYTPAACSVQRVRHSAWIEVYSQLEKMSGQECSSIGKLCSCSWHSAFIVSLKKRVGVGGGEEYDFYI